MYKEIQAGEGKYKVSLAIHGTEGKGLCGFLRGGTRPHVGGVAFAVPRPRSSGDGMTTDISSICAPGHKDVFAAQKVAERICLGTLETVSICAGIHIDKASDEEVRLLMKACLEAADSFVREYSLEEA